MRFLLSGLFLAFAFSFACAQSPGAGPALKAPFAISPTIAKLAERADFEGEWTRFDGTYRFEIDLEGEDGVEARYFNPDPINVESATFEMYANAPMLIVVLRDVGYPGSTYRLFYVVERGVLAGYYERPGAEPAEVSFIKTGD